MPKAQRRGGRTRQTFCPIVPLDLVEDRQRSRIAAVALIVSVFIPIFTYTNLGYDPHWPTSSTLIFDESTINITLPPDVTQAMDGLAVLCIKENMCEKYGDSPPLQTVCEGTKLVCLGEAPNATNASSLDVGSGYTYDVNTTDEEEEEEKLEEFMTQFEGAVMIFAILAVFIGNAAHNPKLFWFPLSLAVAFFGIALTRRNLSALPPCKPFQTSSHGDAQSNPTGYESSASLLHRLSHVLQIKTR